MKDVFNAIKTSNQWINNAEQLATRLLQDEVLLQYLADHHFTKQDVYQNPYIFEKCLKSIYELKHSNHDADSGYFQSVRKEGNFYYLVEEASEELLIIQEKKKHLKNYILNPYLELYDLSFDSLVVQGETEKYLQIYHYLKETDFKEMSKGLYIAGNLGVGKTYLMIALANKVTKQNKTVAFIKLNELLSRYKTIELIADKIVLIEQLKNADLVIFDDIGSEYSTNFVKDEILLPILEHRMNKRMITFFTSNYTLEQLEKIYQEGGKLNDEVNAKRILERIKTLSKYFVLTSRNKRHE